MATNNADDFANPIAVANGCTGNTSQAAFSLVAGGTTTTGAFQAVGPNSSSNAICMSTGTGSLPIFTTSGTPYLGGISFDSGSNTLSTYTSGSFTPVLQFGGATTGITYTTQSGAYWQIGAIVYFKVHILLSSKGTATGNNAITGLPVTVNANSRLNLAFSGLTLAAGFTIALGQAQTATTRFIIVENGSGKNQTALTDTAFSDTTELYVTGFYFTA